MTVLETMGGLLFHSFYDVLMTSLSIFEKLIAARRSQDSQFLADLLIIVAIIGGLWLAVKLLIGVVELFDLSRRAALYTKKAKIAERALRLLEKEQTIRDSPVAQAYADFFYLRDLDVSIELETKKRPARAAAERAREVAIERRQAEKLARLFQGQLEFYESLCPWLTEFKEEGFDELVRKIREGKHCPKPESEGEDPVFSLGARSQIPRHAHWLQKSVSA